MTSIFSSQLQALYCFSVLANQSYNNIRIVLADANTAHQY